jgi:hypothetical protein
MPALWIAVATCRGGDEPPLIVSGHSKEQAESRLYWTLLVKTQDEPDGQDGWTRWPAEEVREG